MRTHQKQLILAIYEGAAGGDGVLSIDFQQWQSEVVANRGELDRKKKISQADLNKVLDLEGGNVDLELLIYSVERYLLLRAFRVVELCVNQDLESIRDLPVILAEAMDIRSLLVSYLTSICESVLREEEAETVALVTVSHGTQILDEFQREFMALVPRQVRHAIGSFYTPQWLARHVLRGTGYRWEEPDSLNQKLCDPSCGSGVFLVAAAEEIRQAVVAGSIPRDTGIDLITTHLSGLDIELVPCLLTLASLVLAARNVSGGEVLDPSLITRAVQRQDSLDPVDPSDVVDVVVGNPPWVNWEYMPAEYKQKHRSLWPELAIYGAESNTFSFSKEDISALFVAHAVSERLKDSGKFAFVLPESLIKSTLNHRGFRRFALGATSDPYRVSSAEDFVKVKPFEGVANRAIVLYGDKSAETKYPLPFVQWLKMDRRKQPISGSAGLNGESLEGAAQLAEANDISSSWSTGSAESIAAHRALDGANHYRARTGLFTGGANAVFHLRLIDDARDGLITVENVVERAKRIAPQVRERLETDFVYPFLRGRDVSQWGYAAELGVLLPHTITTKMKPVVPDVLAATAPRTLAYLEQFKDILDDRKGFSAWEQVFRDTAFYSCQRVGDYTFADWKVVWRYISRDFTTAVVGPIEIAGIGAKPAIVNEKLMLIACSSSEEAYFVGGVLASSVVVQHVHSRMVSTQISPSIVSGISIPAFDSEDAAHVNISVLCRLGHEQVAAGDLAGVSRTIEQLDRDVAALWGLSHIAAKVARQLNPIF